ncbi:hypothetical protein [Vibrio parahaemolyticus]|uniref:hypothetical protein n=1 Tax=Vibrio parahaemolyticus TaxID=670 RepID=UPI000C99EB58|nr:hypothetical protein [Vibrio parahaemolyticus]PMS91930.1 hypothetical protein C1T06_22830 [Vibrio parahaemolyticus]
MNSRILKKLCKRAEKYTKAFKHLERLDEGNDPVSITKFDRKHKEKWCRPKSVSSNYVYLWPGTISYGSMSGGYEPEWEDTPAYFILKEIYFWDHQKWDQNGYKYHGVKRPTPSLIFSYFGI